MPGWRARVPRGGAASIAMILLGVPIMVAASSGLLQVRACLPGQGAAAWWGAHVALLRPDPSCPEGMLAPGAEPGSMLAVVATLTIPMLLAHTGGALAALTLSGALGRAARSIRMILARVARRRPSGVLPVPSHRPANLVTCASSGPLTRHVALAVGTRAPPSPAS